jgi:monoamine oxidase
MMKFNALFEGSNLNELSMKEFSHERTEEDMVPPGGYQHVLEQIYSHCNPNTIFNSRVIFVNYTGDIVVLTTEKG